MTTDLVLLPGLDGSGVLFEPLLQYLATEPRCTVIAYPDRQLGLTELADYVGRRLPAGKSIVLAESFSGLVALSLMTTMQGRLQGLIFVGAFAEPPRPLLLRFGTLVRSAMRFASSAPAFFLRQYCLGGAATAADIRLFRKAISTVSPATLAHRLALVGARHSFGRDTFQVPAVYLQATEDKLVPSASAHWFQKRFKNIRIERLEGPHFLLQARPRESAQRLREVVRTLQVAGG